MTHARFTSAPHALLQFTFSLKAIGTLGTVEVNRGGWGGNRAGYTLSWKKAGDAEPSTKQFPFTGVENEFATFLELVRADIHTRGCMHVCMSKWMGK